MRWLHFLQVLCMAVTCGAIDWTPNYNLTESQVTYVEPPNYHTATWAQRPGYWFPDYPFGLVDLDWLVALRIWYKDGQQKLSNMEAVLTENCRMLKARNLTQRCFIYHNMELALEFAESQRAVMYDPTKADYFLRYANGTIYNEPTVRYGNHTIGDQFFWNHTNPEASDYFVMSVVKSLDDPAVDGTFTDDSQGVPMEHPLVPGKLGMSAAEVKALHDATLAAHARLKDVLGKAGKMTWDSLGGTPAFTREGCQQFMDTYCEPARQTLTMVMTGGPVTNQSIAAFLITRPPIGFIHSKGWGEGQGPFNHSAFMLQPGTPTGLCQHEGPGVYSREWTHGKAVLDCANFTATLPFPSLRPLG